MLEFASCDRSATAVSRISIMRMRQLLPVDMGVVDNLGPAHDLLLDACRELGGRIGDRLEAELIELLFYLRHSDDLDDFAIELVDDRLRRSRRHEHALQSVRLLARYAGLRHRGNVRERRRALGARDRK